MKKPSEDQKSFGMQRQLQIYVGGVKGARPSQPTAISELQRKAREVLTPEAHGYVDGGAGAEETMRANLEAFRSWEIVPRMLRGVGHPDLGVEVLGQKFRSPLLLAPIGVQSIIHPEAEVATARAAASLGVPVVLSTASSRSMEEVAQAMGDERRWFQLYWSPDRDFTSSLLQRAEASGYTALVVTLDTFQLGWRPRDIDNAYLPFLFGEGLGNYLSDPVFLSGLEKSPTEDPQAATLRFASLFADPTLTWDDLAFLRGQTKLPILLKGIQSPDDAKHAVDHGMDGIVVSNHGGRQVDGALGALNALPGVVTAVGDQLAVLFDSGIRQAADIFKAMALGARAVLLGRPYAYGLAVNGEQGVRDLLHNLLAELDLTLSLAGYGSFAEMDREAVVQARPNFFIR